MNLGSVRGSSTYVMAGILLVGISVFAVFTTNVTKRRQRELVALERKHALEAMRIRLENAVRSTHFIEKSFIEANVPVQEFLKKVRESVNSNSAIPSYNDDRLLKVLSPDGSIWLGDGARHRRGSLESCIEGAQCPIESQFFGSVRSQGPLVWFQLKMAISTTDQEQTGPINPQKSSNQISVEFPINFAGAKWESASVECRKGYRAMQLTAPPLELLCADYQD